MNSATKVINDLWSAAVEGSKLAEQFRSFQEQVNKDHNEWTEKFGKLTQDMEYIRERNQRLDSENADLRKQRDGYAQDLAQVRQELNTAQLALRDEQQTSKRHWDDLNEMTDMLAAVRSQVQSGAERIASQMEVLGEQDKRIESLIKERDDAQIQVMELEDQLEQARDRLEAIASAMGFSSKTATPKESNPVEGTSRQTEVVDTPSPSGSGPGGGQSDDANWSLPSWR